MAGSHWLATQRNAPARDIPFFSRACIFATWTFVIVYAVQAWTWRSDVARFAAELRTAPAPFVTTDDLKWVRNSPLEHWSATMLSVIVQGRRPRTIFTERPPGNASGDMALFPGEDGLFSGRDGWFLVDPVHRSAPPARPRR
jgi:hypothetical protein